MSHEGAKLFLSDLPAVTRDQMREVDRLMVEEYRVDLLQMMENAGLQLANLAGEVLAEPIGAARVVVLAGKGNNAGGGINAGRRLANWGARVTALLSQQPHEYTAVPAKQLQAFARAGGRISTFEGRIPSADFLIDALVGYSLRGTLNGITLDIVSAANSAGVPVLSLDLPSGIDADVGTGSGEVIRAIATMTLALPKIGLLDQRAEAFTGDIYLADIGVPPAVYRSLGLTHRSPFERGPLVRLYR